MKDATTSKTEEVQEAIFEFFGIAAPIDLVQHSTQSQEKVRVKHPNFPVREGILLKNKLTIFYNHRN